ncbi:MAG: hypothetical protein ACM3PP_12145 [Candidatus Saccharibacteria bacterium]
MVKTVAKKRPPVWMLVREAVESMDGEASYQDIKEYIWRRHKDIKERTINCQIIICCVNQKSRVYYPPNRKPRECSEKYDFLYNLGNGKVAIYDPDKHGRWSIIEENSRLKVIKNEFQAVQKTVANRLVEQEQTRAVSEVVPVMRDVVVTNLALLKPDLKLYQDVSGRPGIEYPTEAGIIDILAIDGEGRFTVVEIADPFTPEVMTRMLSCMGWVRKHLASGHEVRAIVLTNQVDNSILWSATAIPQIEICQLQVSMVVNRLSA